MTPIESRTQDINQATVPLRAGIVVTSIERTVDGRRAGCWLADIAYPWRALRRNGWDVEFICPRVGRAVLGGVDRSDPAQRAFLNDSVARQRFARATAPDLEKATDFSLVYFAGGVGALEELPDSQSLTSFTQGAAQGGAVLAATGHGAAGLIRVNDRHGISVLNGRRVTTSPLAEDREMELPNPATDLTHALSKAGASVIFGDPFHPHVVVDGPLVTGQNPASSMVLAAAILSVTTAVTATGGPSSVDETSASSTRRWCGPPLWPRGTEC